ncbi:MAG TPA: pitrilysin family protein [Acidobacteriota bacterium]|jgi:zinc protease|nr:pitrilysin family protein [Acidobacteriota bacterium]
MERHKIPAIPVLRQLLPNGVVLLISGNPKIPLVHVNVVVRCGTAENPPSRPGLASLMTRMFDEGTSRFSHQQIAETIENLGGSLTTFSNRELSGVSVSVLSKDLQKGIDLAHAVITDPVFPADRLELEKEKVVNHIRSSNDNPQFVASNEFNRLIYRHPVGEPIQGDEHSVGVATSKELLEFHQKTFSPKNTLIAMVGAVEPEQGAALLSERFSKWQNDGFTFPPVPALDRAPRKLLKEISMPKEQIHIYLGHLGIDRRDPDYYALQVMDIILGGGPGFTSRIPAKLRDQQGLAYTTYCDIASSAGLYPGRFVAFISTSPGNRDKALDGLIGEIKSLVDHGITDNELHDAQSYLTGNFVFDFQSNGHVARFLLSAELFHLGFDFLDHYPRIIREITKANVEQVARKHIDPENCTTVIAGAV